MLISLTGLLHVMVIDMRKMYVLFVADVKFEKKHLAKLQIFVAMLVYLYQ